MAALLLPIICKCIDLIVDSKAQSTVGYIQISCLVREIMEHQSTLVPTVFWPEILLIRQVWMFCSSLEIIRFVINQYQLWTFSFTSADIFGFDVIDPTAKILFVFCVGNGFSSANYLVI